MNSPVPMPPRTGSAIRLYPQFLRRAWGVATEGGWLFLLWMTFLTIIALVGANAWAVQVRDGMIRTHLSDHVSWGLYIANFTFCVGLAAGGVMMVIPAYLYHDRDMQDIVIVGEILAIAAILMSILSVVVDLGRPDRFWHLIPGIGKFHWPISMLTWDVIALNGYLLINLHVVGYLMYMRFLGREPNRKWYVPFVFLSIVWAISIHMLTAFLYCGLGGRPYWNTALLAPRFLASAFVSGPCLILSVLHVLRLTSALTIAPEPARLLVQIIRIAMVVHGLMLLSELFTVFYAGGSHAASASYLFLGVPGHRGWAVWIWTALLLQLLGTILFFTPAALERTWTYIAACLLCFVGIWMEKGLGLIVPGFIPSPLHEFAEYTPSVIEWKITAGIWAFGMMIFTVLLKIAVAVLTGQMQAHSLAIPTTSETAAHP